MNEKIKQFGEQAIHYAASRPMSELKDRDLYLDNLFEKFAELLLNEIANTAVIYDGYIDESRQLAVKLHLGDFRKRIPIIGD